MRGTHYLTLEEVRQERERLLGELVAQGLSEAEVYQYASEWRLRPQERAIFQKISDYDWILEMSGSTDHPRAHAA